MGRGPWVVGRGVRAVGRGPWAEVMWAVDRGSRDVGRGPWAEGFLHRRPCDVCLGLWAMDRGPWSRGVGRGP